MSRYVVAQKRNFFSKQDAGPSEQSNGKVRLTLVVVLNRSPSRSVLSRVHCGVKSISEMTSVRFLATGIASALAHLNYNVAAARVIAMDVTIGKKAPSTRSSEIKSTPGA